MTTTTRLFTLRTPSTVHVCWGLTSLMESCLQFFDDFIPQRAIFEHARTTGTDDTHDLECGSERYTITCHGEFDDGILNQEMLNLMDSNYDRDALVPDWTPAPGYEVFQGKQHSNEDLEPEKWYWWSCQPGCIPDGEPNGPFDTEDEACKDSWGKD